MADGRPLRSDPGDGAPAVFLDRDGTLIEEIGYLNRPHQIQPIAGAARAVREVNRAGLTAVVVTNQSAVARGLLSIAELEEIHRELARVFHRQGAALDYFYYCPHHPDFSAGPDAGPCPCRKPRPGLLRRAAADLGISLNASFAVGDRLRDTEAGRRAGCRTVLVRTGYGAAEERRLSDPDGASLPAEAAPDFVADDLGDAVRWILERRHG